MSKEIKLKDISSIPEINYEEAIEGAKKQLEEVVSEHGDNESAIAPLQTVASNVKRTHQELEDARKTAFKPIEDAKKAIIRKEKDLLSYADQALSKANAIYQAHEAKRQESQKAQQTAADKAIEAERIKSGLSFKMWKAYEQQMSTKTADTAKYLIKSIQGGMKGDPLANVFNLMSNARFRAPLIEYNTSAKYHTADEVQALLDEVSGLTLLSIAEDYNVKIKECLSPFLVNRRKIESYVNEGDPGAAIEFLSAYTNHESNDFSKSLEVKATSAAKMTATASAAFVPKVDTQVKNARETTTIEVTGGKQALIEAVLLGLQNADEKALMANYEKITIGQLLKKLIQIGCPEIEGIKYNTQKKLTARG